MAFGAFQADPKEQLAEEDRAVFGGALVPVDGSRCETMIAALQRQDGSDKCIIGHVFSEGLPHPLVEHIDAFDACSIRVGAQQIGPFDGPVITDPAVGQ